jgi:hypothetical protein
MFDQSTATSDAALLDAAPDYLCITQMLKATPKVEGGERFIYIEASNEAVDQQGEVVMAKALAESADFFLKYGNLDIDHLTMIGPKMGVPNSNLYEIGRPVEVKSSGGKTFVKGHIVSGTGPAAEQANSFWSGLVDIQPAQRWYPSVGGSVMAKAVEFDPKTQKKRVVITKTRWSNIGFSRTPINSNVPTVSTMPFGALIKSWGVAGIDLSKALTSGYGTDSAALAGGGALRSQSLAGAVSTYQQFRDNLAQAIRGKHAGANPGAGDLVDYSAMNYGLSHDEAAEWVERFLRDLHSQLSKSKRKSK